MTTTTHLNARFQDLEDRVEFLEKELETLRHEMSSRTSTRWATSRARVEEAIVGLLEELPAGVKLSASAIVEALTTRTGHSPANATIHKYAAGLAAAGRIQKEGPSTNTRYFKLA